MAFNIVLVGLFVLLAIIIGVVVYRIFFMPVKLDAIAKMIRSGQNRQAISSLNSIITNEPNNHLARYYLGKAYHNLEQRDRALVEYRHVSKYIGMLHEVKELDFRKELASLLDDLRMYDDAFKEYLLLTQLTKTDEEVYFKLGELYMRRQAYDKAQDAFQMAYKINPKSDQTNYYLGYLLTMTNNYRDAKVFLDKATKLNNRNAHAWYYLGIAYQKLDQLQMAINAFSNAENDDEFSLKAFIQKGLAYMSTGSIDNAISELQTGESNIKEPQDPAAINLRYVLAQCLEKNRDLPGAIDQWEKINEIQPDFRDVAKKLKLYQDLRHDDNLKDFLVISDNKFERYCINLISSLNYSVMETYSKDKVVNISAITKRDKGDSSNLRNAVLFKITRATTPIPEAVIRDFAEEVKSRRATKGIFVTSGEFSKEAGAFAETRPIDLVDQKGLTRLLKNI